MVCHGNFVGHVSRVFHVSFKEVLICNFVVLQAAQNSISHKKNERGVYYSVKAVLRYIKNTIS